MSANNVSKIGVEKFTGPEDRAQKRLNLQFLRMVTMIMR